MNSKQLDIFQSFVTRGMAAQAAVDDAIAEAKAKGDAGIAKAKRHAEADQPGFTELAARSALIMLRLRGPMTGEMICDECKKLGHRPKNDKAFGAVIRHLIKRKEIIAIGTAARRKGHGSSGATLWRAK